MKIHDLALGRHALGGEPGPGKQAEHVVVDHDAGHHGLVAFAAAGVAVHRLDEGRDAARAVADDAGGHALGHRHDRAVHHEDPVVVALIMLLDDDVACVPRGLREARPHRIGVREAMLTPRP